MNTKLIAHLEQLMAAAKDGSIIGLAYATVGEGDCPNGWEVVEGVLTEPVARALTNATFTVANHMVKVWFTPIEATNDAPNEIVEH